MEICSADYQPGKHDQGVWNRTSTLFGPRIFSEFVATTISVPKDAVGFKSRASGHPEPKKLTFELKSQSVLITSWYPAIEDQEKVVMAEYFHCFFYPSILKDILVSMDFSKTPGMQVNWKFVSVPTLSKSITKAFNCDEDDFNRALNQLSLRTLTSPDHQLWFARANLSLDEKPPALEVIMTFQFTTDCLQDYLSNLVRKM